MVAVTRRRYHSGGQAAVSSRASEVNRPTAAATATGTKDLGEAQTTTSSPNDLRSPVSMYRGAGSLTTSGSQLTALHHRHRVSSSTAAGRRLRRQQQQRQEEEVVLQQQPSSSAVDDLSSSDSALATSSSSECSSSSLTSLTGRHRIPSSSSSAAADILLSLPILDAEPRPAYSSSRLQSASSSSSAAAAAGFGDSIPTCRRYQQQNDDTDVPPSSRRPPPPPVEVRYARPPPSRRPVPAEPSVSRCTERSEEEQSRRREASLLQQQQRQQRSLMTSTSRHVESDPDQFPDVSRSRRPISGRSSFVDQPMMVQSRVSGRRDVRQQQQEESRTDHSPVIVESFPTENSSRHPSSFLSALGGDVTRRSSRFTSAGNSVTSESRRRLQERADKENRPPVMATATAFERTDSEHFRFRTDDNNRKLSMARTSTARSSLRSSFDDYLEPDVSDIRPEVTSRFVADESATLDDSAIDDSEEPLPVSGRCRSRRQSACDVIDDVFSDDENDGATRRKLRRTDGCARLQTCRQLVGPSLHPSVTPTTDRSRHAGELEMSAYVNSGHLTVHIIKARHLPLDNCLPLDTTVQVSLIPSPGCSTLCRTDIIQDTAQPLYDEKFSFELGADDLQRRLLITLWQTSDADPALDRLIGATSFGILNIASNKTIVEGWYRLLDDVRAGRTKHQMATPKRTLQRALEDLETHTVTLHRPANGSNFGFTLMGGRPCTVGRVEGDGAAAAAGLRHGDVLLRVNGHNVFGASTDCIARIVRYCQRAVVMEIRRRQTPPTAEQLRTIALAYSVTDDVTYSSSDDDDDDDVSSLMATDDDSQFEDDDVTFMSRR